MSERKFVMRQFFMKSDKLSKFHLFEVDDDAYYQVALCGAKDRRPKSVWGMLPQTIDQLLASAHRRYKRYNNRQPCKRCLAKAEALRNPLERLADV